jgi:hypothetical protein
MPQSIDIAVKIAIDRIGDIREASNLNTIEGTITWIRGYCMALLCADIVDNTGYDRLKSLITNASKLRKEELKKEI